MSLIPAFELGLGNAWILILSLFLVGIGLWLLIMRVFFRRSERSRIEKAADSSTLNASTPHGVPFNEKEKTLHHLLNRETYEQEVSSYLVGFPDLQYTIKDMVILN